MRFHLEEAPGQIVEIIRQPGYWIEQPDKFMTKFFVRLEFSDKAKQMGFENGLYELKSLMCETIDV